MVDESKLHLEASRGDQAKGLLDNELLKEAFSTLEAEYIEHWKITPARDTEARERLWQAVQIVGKVRTHLTSAVNNGTLAKHELNQLAAQKQSLLSRLKS